MDIFEKLNKNRISIIDENGKFTKKDDTTFKKYQDPLILEKLVSEIDLKHLLLVHDSAFSDPKKLIKGFLASLYNEKQNDFYSMNNKTFYDNQIIKNKETNELIFQKRTEKSSGVFYENIQVEDLDFLRYTNINDQIQKFNTIPFENIFFNELNEDSTEQELKEYKEFQKTAANDIIKRFETCNPELNPTEQALIFAINHQIDNSDTFSKCLNDCLNDNTRFGILDKEQVDLLFKDTDVGHNFLFKKIMKLNNDNIHTIEIENEGIYFTDFVDIVKCNKGNDLNNELRMCIENHNKDKNIPKAFHEINFKLKDDSLIYGELNFKSCKGEEAYISEKEISYISKRFEIAEDKIENIIDLDLWSIKEELKKRKLKQEQKVEKKKTKRLKM